MHTRPTWAEVSLRKLADNFRTITTRVAPSAAVCAVVKADAYGHGAEKCAQALQQAGAEWLGVASVEEGVCLREAGIPQSVRILVMGGIWEREADAVIQHQLTPSVWEPFHLDWLEEATRRQKGGLRSEALPPVPVHLEIDTGMSRQGVLPGNVPAILDRFTAASPLKLEGVYSHFASSEVLDDDAARQMRVYEQTVAEVLRRGHAPVYSHFANSAAIVTRPESWNEQCPVKLANTLVRPGLALYGYSLPLATKSGGPAPHSHSIVPLPVQPILNWKTRIVSVRGLPAGQAIGYSGTYVTKSAARVASIPVGYADGLSRKLSNRGEVLVRGVKAPIVGNLSMDITVIDVTHVPTASVGDEVVLIGAQQGTTITADDHAAWIGTISYEVLCNIGKRVPRVYLE